MNIDIKGLVCSKKYSQQGFCNSTIFSCTRIKVVLKYINYFHETFFKINISIKRVHKADKNKLIKKKTNSHLYLQQDEGESVRASPIPEEDIEEDLVPAMDSVSLDSRDKPTNKPPSFKPTDTIVLELEAPPTKGKSLVQLKSELIH